MPHRTTRGAGGGAGLWLGSLVLYSNCLQYVGPDGVTVEELRRLAGARTNLNGMRRWGYVKLARVDGDDVIRRTRAGARAQEVWRPLPVEIETRWRERFGEPDVDRLRSSLSAVVGRFHRSLPEGLPILFHGLHSSVDAPEPRADDASQRSLPTLLSQALLGFALPFEQRSKLSLAITANIVRVLGEEPTRPAEITGLAGVSIESVRMAVGYLSKREYVAERTAGGGARGKTVVLTERGLRAQQGYPKRLSAIERRWREEFGADVVDGLRGALEELASGDGDGRPRLFAGLQPYPDGWRASVRRPRTLPHYPMVLHRGGYPDGS
jgi:DNA-binding MarR family transcriptional regulator